MTDLKKREEQLRARLGELDSRLHRIDDHLKKPADPDWEEEAQEAEMDEVLEGLGEAGTAEVVGIRAALGRIQAGTYGDCVKCGEEISEERLDVPQAAEILEEDHYALGDVKDRILEFLAVRVLQKKAEDAEAEAEPVKAEDQQSAG